MPVAGAARRIERRVSPSADRFDAVGGRACRRDRPLRHRLLAEVVMVEMNVGGHNDDVVVRVLEFGQGRTSIGR